MRKHTLAGSRCDELNLRFARRGPIVNCKRLMVLGLFTILFVALTQSGCTGVISARSPLANSAPSITTGPLPNAQLGVQFQGSLTAAGGVQPYLWSIASGNLPPGVTLNAATGMLSGTPSQEGQFDFSAQVRDSSPTPQTAMKALTLSVLAFTLQISPGALPTGQVDVPFQATITGAGGVTPYTWSVAGALPSGLTLNASSGAITGTPTLAGTSAFTIELTDSSGNTAQMASGITIAAAGPPVCAAPISPTASGLSLVCSGTGITVESARQFRLVFEAADNWGLSQWYDLVNDPTATTNLALAYGVGGPSQACARENGIPQITLYGDFDNKASTFIAGCIFPSASRSITILTNTTSQVVLQTVGHPMASSIDTNVTVTTTYDIRPDGHIYLHQNLAVVNAANLNADNYVLEVGLNDPSGGSATTTTSGWIRATDAANPFTSTSPWANYAFAYWNTSDPSFPNFTKASILLVPGKSARTLWASNGGQIVHGWACGTGCGTQRWGFRTGNGDTNFNLAAGGSISWDWMIVLGTQGSSLLSNFTSSTVAGPIANAYLANPVPPAQSQ